VPCAACKADLLSGLPFCAHCGTFRRLELEPGRKCVTLLGGVETAPLSRFLAEQFPDVPPARIDAALSRAPRVLVQGVSAPTAAALMHQLSVFPCELAIADHIATAMKVPGVHALIGIALVLPLFWTADRISVTARVLSIVAAELAIVALYWRRTRPAIPIAALRRRPARARVDFFIEALASRLRLVVDTGVRAALARITRSYVAIVPRLERSGSVLRTEEIERCVLAAFDAANVLERHRSYLSSTSCTDIQRRLQTVAGELRRKHRNGQDARLIQLKTELGRELRNYREIEDEHAALYLAVIKLHGVLLQLEDTLLEDGGTEAIRPDLSEIEAELGCPTYLTGGVAHVG
jgi:hypothetical protein